MQDIRLIERARKERWPVTQESMDRIYQRVEEIALTFPDVAISVQAAKLITAMHGQNQKDEPSLQQVEHHHTHEVDHVTADNIESKRAELHSRLDRLRQSR